MVRVHKCVESSSDSDSNSDSNHHDSDSDSDSNHHDSDSYSDSTKMNSVTVVGYIFLMVYCFLTQCSKSYFNTGIEIWHIAVVAKFQK